MFVYFIRYQIAATCIFLLMVVDYIKNRNMKLLSTKCLSWWLAMLGFNLCMDFTTVYTVNHLEAVSPMVNRICHQFFIGSIIGVMCLNFLYILTLGNEQKRPRGIQLIYVFGPLFVAILMILFGDLRYHIDTQNGCYSYGVMAYTVYACGFLYLLMSFAITLNPNKKFASTYSIIRTRQYVIGISDLFSV